MNRGKGLGVLGLIAAVFCTSADASIIDGSVTFGEPSEWSADVSYAVYAPGTYPGDRADKDTMYVYTYQVFNDASSTATLSSFSVGLLDGAGAVSPDDDPTYGVAGGVAPLLSRLVGSPPTSVQWTIDVDADEHTTLLLFSSPYNYTFKAATVANGGDGDTHLMPTPLPEPVSLSLLALGAMALVRRRR